MPPELCLICKHLAADCECDSEFADLVEVVPPLKRRKSGNLTSTVATHSTEVFNWRKDGFLALGFSMHRAEFLAETNVELALARKMHSQGCPLLLIEDILLGTCFAGDDPDWGKPRVARTVEDDEEDAA